jgi:hypothetical protein
LGAWRTATSWQQKKEEKCGGNDFEHSGVGMILSVILSSPKDLMFPESMLGF